MAPIFLLTTHQVIAKPNHHSFVTYADGRTDGGIRQNAEESDGLDGPGDIFVFDQQLLSEDTFTVIGRNSGYCIRTDPGAPDFSSTDHPTLPDDPDNNYGQCTWTLTFNENSEYSGSLTVSGREADLGTSEVAIIGGTGDFTGATGVMTTTPIPQDGDGVLFRQEIVISKHHKKHHRR
ncbi:MAG: dirigent protein [Alteromonadaceae bacterium]|nr:dirigent protein [Alteromonadaceae bacterium]